MATMKVHVTTPSDEKRDNTVCRHAKLRLSTNRIRYQRVLRSCGCLPVPCTSLPTANVRRRYDAGESGLTVTIADGVPVI